MRKTNFVYALATLPLLMSATPLTSHYSNIAGKTYNGEINKVIVDNSKQYKGTSNGDSGKNIAMEVTVDYELFEMGKNILYNSAPTVYSFIYRIHVDLKETYQYKSGWWIFASTYNSMPFLSEISTDLNISGLSNSFNVISNSPDIESNSSYNAREDGLDFSTTGGSLSQYSGAYYFTPVYYFKPSSVTTNNDIFFARKNVSSSSTDYILKTNAYYDTNILHSYTATDVYYFGGVSFASDTLPTNIDLSIDVKCGGTQNNELKCNYLTSGSVSNQLSSYEINELISDGYRGNLIQRNYDNIVATSDSIDII